MAQMVMNLPAIQKTQVQCLGWEDPRWREWLLILVLLPGEFHGQRSLEDSSSGRRFNKLTTKGPVGFKGWGMPLLLNGVCRHWSCYSMCVIFHSQYDTFGQPSWDDNCSEFTQHSYLTIWHNTTHLFSCQLTSRSFH